MQYHRFSAHDHKSETAPCSLMFALNAAWEKQRGSCKVRRVSGVSPAFCDEISRRAALGNNHVGCFGMALRPRGRGCMLVAAASRSSLPAPVSAQTHQR
jgi:hypothetical protein